MRGKFGLTQDVLGDVLHAETDAEHGEVDALVVHLDRAFEDLFLPQLVSRVATTSREKHSVDLSHQVLDFFVCVLHEDQGNHSSAAQLHELHVGVWDL